MWVLILALKVKWGIPWWSNGSDSAIFLLGPWVQSLVRELRSHKSCDVTKKEKRKKNKTIWVFPGGPVGKTSPCNAGVSSSPGQGTKIPHALQPENQNRKRQYCNKFNKDFKRGPHKKKKKKTWQKRWEDKAMKRHRKKHRKFARVVPQYVEPWYQAVLGSGAVSPLVLWDIPESLNHFPLVVR